MKKQGRKFSYYGEQLTASQLSILPECVVSEITLRYRLFYTTWSVEKSMMTPAQKRTTKQTTKRLRSKKSLTSEEAEYLKETAIKEKKAIEKRKARNKAKRKAAAIKKNKLDSLLLKDEKKQVEINRAKEIMSVPQRAETTYGHWLLKSKISESKSRLGI